MKWVRTTPLRVWLICAFFALLQPLMHALVQYCPPTDTVITGLHKPDSAIYIAVMRMFETGFYSPYATCQSPIGTHSARFFSHPSYVPYAIVGSLRPFLNMSDFTMLGIADGVGGFFYLLAVYRFLLAVVPKLAGRAFALFAFSGGLGGPIYLVCAALGITATPSFSEWFYRFAIYDLVEGTNLAPHLLLTRLYYTLPLALGFAGLTTCISAWRAPCRVRLAFAQLLLFACAFINARLGPSLGLIAVLYLAQHQWTWRKPFHVGVPLVLGVISAATVLRWHPAILANYVGSVRQQMWLTSYVSSSFPLLLAAAPVALRDGVRLRGAFRILADGCFGYLAVYIALFFLYQGYYGTLLLGADHAAALRVSDPALLGFVLGALWGLRRPAGGENPAHAWIVVWAVLFSAVALSAFGNGWFLQFSPQRLMVFIGLPLSVIAAESLERLRAAMPNAARALVAIVVVCGVTSLLVATLVFQGPLGMQAGLASNIGMHTAYLRRDDAACLERLAGGTVAAPPPYNDILSVRDGVSVLGGYGSLALSDQTANLHTEVDRFFSTECTAPDRVRFLRRWCVSYVFLPSDQDHSPVLAGQFDRMDELQRVSAVGNAHLYKVR